ncbi:3'-5' exonuclease family protein [Parachitinimonas caeni]|uniref:DNA-directed DNA polymerase n=1 Tax=Parachitinimonas caeni TaxID=3031301 RepID=A0ABT7DWY2_9NEIS|nr:3'-5' exonuclease family protein [Parachitinimonas caeni]MDK2124579.1 exonuclease domain-containing protein [Parachitinimonas caeni]
MLLLNAPAIFIDLETTGANAGRDRITEIGVVEVGPEGMSEWSTLVNPKTPIPPFIQRLTGINDEMVADAPTFAELAEALHERLAGRVFYAHNARFDYSFLKAEFARVGLKFRADVVCTVRLSRKLYPNEYRHNLDTLVARHGLGEEVRHRALGDARLIYRFMQIVRRDIAEDTIEAVLAELSKRPTLPPGLDAEQLDDLPEGHGVYLFYGDNDLPLYVGKSNTLRKRVLSHFTADATKQDQDIARSIKRIDWIECAGELGALLQEARLVKALQPLHNHRLRRHGELCAWRFLPNAEGNARPELVFAHDVDFGKTTDLYGLYASQREATNTLRKLAEVHRLCHIALGLEKAGKRAASPCFGFQIGKCRGVCVGKEDKLAHQARVSSVLAKLTHARWPYPGPIAVVETEERTDSTQLHVIDRWHYLGSARDEAELAELVAERDNAEFDVDVYKILVKFLSAKKAVQVKVL